MASNRYGRIYHGNHHYNNIKFPSADAREQFAEKVKKYHDSHDHDGEAPRFEFLKASEIKSYDRGPKAVDQVTIDGYTSNEIKKYHNREHPDTYTHYRVPTCCLSPIIVLDREFIDAGTLKRHELSSIFGDMPETDFENLVKSVEQDGFMDSLIRVLDGKVLDGWHRYRAALSLNLVRKLMFMHWDAEKEGKAVAFVAARNIERRHLSASQRAQIVVSLNERFGWGGDRSKTPNDALKSKAELAAQAKVGISSIDRAVKVEKLGKAENVIAGEKSSAQVIVEETVNDLWQQVSAEMKDWKQRHSDDNIGHASKMMLVTSLRIRQYSEAQGAATLAELKGLLALMQSNSRSFVLRVKQTLTGEEPDEILVETNPYTDTYMNQDEYLVNSLIPSFKRLLTSDPYNSDNAVEKLQMIRQELTRRGHFVDENMNVVRHAPEPEPEVQTPEPETADETPEIDVSDMSGCREALRRILNVQGELNKGNIDYSDLCERYNLKKTQVQEIADSVRSVAFKREMETHNTYRDQIRNFWLNNTNLSDALDLHELQTKLIEMFVLRESAFKKTFHGLSLKEIESEAATLQEIYDELTRPESELLKKVLGAKTLVEVVVSFADAEGEIYQMWFSGEGDGLPLEELPIIVRMSLERLSKNAEPFESAKV